MFRDDIIFIVPTVLIAFFQIKIIWENLPLFYKNESQVQGGYSQTVIDLFNNAKYLIYAILSLQLSFSILPITNSQSIINVLRVFGYTLVLSGFFISLRALHDLDKSWSSMVHYRIKKGQKLITSGVYKHIRHPIYLSVILELVGYELIVGSWIFIFFFLASIIVFSLHIEREEKLLEDYYKGQYNNYRVKSNKLIPKIY